MSYINAILFNKLLEDGALCDLEYILKKSFASELIRATGAPSTDDIPPHIAAVLSGQSGKDTYLLAATCVMTQADSSGVGTLLQLVKNTLLTGQPTRTITSMSTNDLFTTSVAHGFLVGDIITITGVTNGQPDINSGEFRIFEVATTTTFKIGGIEVLTAATNGSAVKKYAASGETILEEYNQTINTGSSGGQGGAGTQTQIIFKNVGFKIVNGEDIFVQQAPKSAGGNRGTNLASNLLGQVVNTGVDPTL